MPTNIFSTYSTGENRVTASILAVLRSLSLDRSQRLLAALLERTEFELVRFQNQPSKGSAGVPDAIIRASCCILIETKIRPNRVDLKQLQRHLKRLKGFTEETCALLVLTPDGQQPPVFKRIQSPLIAWASFAALDQSIDELLDDSQEVVSEREAFLLRELQAMLQREELITIATDVVVVAARRAWPDYQRYHAYVCQADRAFQAVNRIAFYTDGAIQPLVPKFLEVRDSVAFVKGAESGKLGTLIKRTLADGVRTEGSLQKVMLLSPPDSKETVRLDAAIINDLTAKSGRPTAFTQGQRYVSLERMRSARNTSELVEVG